MSQMAPKTCEEGVFQYCNYGYDKTKHTSFEDCKKQGLKKCPSKNPIIVKTKRMWNQSEPQVKVLLGILVLAGIYGLYKITNK